MVNVTNGPDVYVRLTAFKLFLRHAFFPLREPFSFGPL
jgi:hypothetical protein